MPKAGKHTMQLDFKSPKKNGTVTIKFRITNDAGGNKFDITASFDVTKGEDAAEKAKKAHDAIKAQINALAAANQGAEVAQGKVNFPSGKEVLMPTIFIRNKQGFSLSKFDYDNGKSKEKGTATPIDTSEPEEDASDDRQDETAIRFYGETSKGTAMVRVGEQPEIRVDTAGLSMMELHRSIAAHLQEVGVTVDVAEGVLAQPAGEGGPAPELHLNGLSDAAVEVDADDDTLGFVLVRFAEVDDPA